MLGLALLFLNHKKPLEGFEYLYLTEDDYKDLPDGAVMGEWTEVGYALKAVVGLGLSRLDDKSIFGSNEDVTVMDFCWGNYETDVLWILHCEKLIFNLRFHWRWHRSGKSPGKWLDRRRNLASVQRPSANDGLTVLLWEM